MIINNVKLDIDFTDADILERIEQGSKKVYEEAEILKQTKNNISPAEGIRQECKILKDFLDYVLGEGTSQKVFGEKNSLLECLKAFEDIIETRNVQYKKIQEQVSKYSPERFKR